MLRGFLAGIFWGVILIGGVLAATSLLSPLPATVAPQTSAQAPIEAQDPPVQSGDLGATSQADMAVEATSSTAVPEAEAGDQPPISDTASAPKPQAESVEAELAAPVAPEASGAVALEAESPVFPNPQAQTPTAPVPDSELSISTNPAQPTSPDVADGETFETPAVVESTDQTAPENPAEAVEVETESSEQSLVSDPQPSPEAEDVTPNAEAEEEPASEEVETALLKPVGDIEEAFPQHKSDRLPTVGADTDSTTGEESAPVPSRPVEANAEVSENTDNKPLMAIVLVDTGEHSFDMEALVSFPYPLTIAVSTLDPEVSAKTKDYRDRGFEVLAMVDVPAEATAADVEQAMQAHLSVSDQFVGVIEGLSDGLQGSKVISDQVTEALLSSGHGLLMFPNGLNTAQKLAAKEGVPSASVFRDFDDKGQTAVVMRRFLDQAAFKAGQEDGVVMVGRLRDEAISALLLWALQDRAGTVAMAPVSAVFATIN
ncbi:hypothetical protein NBRC116594_03730 [Shimia sp. NS0008-38b]|uniref:divergent polysaccharide deacetylase family protein n=1 Tax=Shimia sp. NS0008-38b TaxID=3127653 RepID=UPI00310B43BF